MARAPPGLLPDPATCSLWLPQKRRYCRFVRVNGTEYCSHHVTTGKDGEAERMPCPLDPSHSIFTRDLKRHLKICPKAKQAAVEAQLPCFRRNCNVDETCAQVENPSYALEKGSTLRTSRGALPSVERILSLINVIRKAYAMHAQPAIIPDPPATCDGEVQHTQEQSPSRGKKAEKHAMQHRGMLRELRTLCKGDESTVFVELGAGNGGLTSAVCEWATTSSFILVDWAKPQKAFDAALRGRGLSLARYKLDLRHFWMRGVPELGWDSRAACASDTDVEKASSTDAGAPLMQCTACDDDGKQTASPTRVAIAKHLCGCATDFALRSIVAAGTDGVPGAAGEGGKSIAGASVATHRTSGVDAVMIATCCHQKCTWATYVNRPFLEGLGIDEEAFALITLMSSWATANEAGEEMREGNVLVSSGPAIGAGAPSVIADEPEEENEHAAAAEDRHDLSRLSQLVAGHEALGGGAARRELGRMCKRLLDTGRMRFLEREGCFASTSMREYVSRTVTPENVLLCAL